MGKLANRVDQSALSNEEQDQSTSKDQEQSPTAGSDLATRIQGNLKSMGNLEKIVFYTFMFWVAFLAGLAAAGAAG